MSKNAAAAAAQPAQGAEEPTIDRVKELLFGQEQRQTDERFALMEQELRALEKRFDEKLEALAKCVGELDVQQTSDLEQRLTGVSESVLKLGAAIKTVAAPKT